MVGHLSRATNERLEQPAPWRGVAVESTAFCSLWTTGDDTAVDGVVRLLAIRRGPDPGRPERFDRRCNPFAGREGSRAALEGIERDLGISAAELETAAPAEEAWQELRRFLGGSPLVVADAESFESWDAHLAGRALDRRVAIGVSELASLLAPGRISDAGTDARAGITPDDLRSALHDVARRFLARDAEVLDFGVRALVRAWTSLAAGHPRAAERLLLALALLDRPSAWAGGPSGPGDLEDGRLSACARPDSSAVFPEALLPRCATEEAARAGFESVPPDVEAQLPFDPADRALLDRVFEAHLPAQFASGAPGERRPSYRPGQHEVARVVADALGSGELLLVHAPTGTGKTLAYLVPALLWSIRHGVRVGVATYTRALQEQAMSREVPRALDALAAAGATELPRVCALKGRENYLCWRALKLAAPDEEDEGEAWLAWAALALFALTDPEGDLDRLPLRAPLPLEAAGRWREALGALLRQVRARGGCCTNRADRETCAAEIARRRAERSHVVITNQAFALARQEFFKHVVFDECEHLHDQAHGAWSHSAGFRSMRGVLARLHQPRRGGSRASLDRLKRALLEGTPSRGAVEQTIAACSDAASALDALEAEVVAFDAWRAEEARKREDRDQHSLLREYVDARESGPLVAARVAFSRAWNELDSALAELSERLDAMPLRGLSRVRRAHEMGRTEIQEVLAAVEAWLPLDEGKPAFRATTFHDVERDARGDLVLAARVLLPNEFLGRNYYPQISSGVFLSATTWLQRSFEPALGYLGLDRAAQPAEGEDRVPRIVRAFRAPDVFDYARVLVAVPRDAPPVAADKEAFLAYVRRFVAHLGERTRGRMLVLFTNAQDAVRVGEDLRGFFRARCIPLWFQNMEGTAKEEISDLFRSCVDSVLLGVDTFWYGADFPGETLEYLVIVRLPYGVPDRYHHAQCAALGASDQRRRIYMPRALAKFRQGFGRLMRKESDRGCVFVLDGRVLEPRHRAFLRELPLASLDPVVADEPSGGARLVRGETDRCIREALLHMGLAAEVERRGLDWSFSSAAPS